MGIQYNHTHKHHSLETKTGIGVILLTLTLVFGYRGTSSKILGLGLTCVLLIVDLIEVPIYLHTQPKMSQLSALPPSSLPTLSELFRCTTHEPRLVCPVVRTSLHLTKLHIAPAS